jgi:flagellar biosynthetic protein FliP
MNIHLSRQIATWLAWIALLAWSFLGGLVQPASAQLGPAADELVPQVSLPSNLTGGLNPSELAGANPLEMLSGAASMLQRGAGNQTSQDPQSGEQAPLSSAISIMLVLTVITLVPSIVLMCTSFIRIIVVLGLLKQALGTQQLPPSQTLMGLALAMTMLVMAPTIDRIYTEAVVPYRQGEVKNYDELWNRAKQPVRDFMFAQIEASGNSSTILTLHEYRTGKPITDPGAITRADIGMQVLVPAFIVSELKVAFLMGFRIYLPFLVIDMVIAAILIAMNMMMLPPVLISLPFKLLLFVLVDGWTLVVGALLHSFDVGRTPIDPAATAGSLPPIVPFTPSWPPEVIEHITALHQAMPLLGAIT